MDGRTGNGGRPARRAIVRWAWRLVRRDWRQQLLILVLLVLAIAGAAAGASAAYNLPQPANAELGAANHGVVLRAQGEARAGQLASNLATVRAAFDSAEVITQRTAAIPGSTEFLVLRGQDPAAPLGRPLLGLRSGRYPAAPGETAVTDRVASVFGIGVGGDLLLDGATLHVVGTVENPKDLSDEFALLPPSDDDAESAQVLVRASDEVFDRFAQQPHTDMGFLRPHRGAEDNSAIGVLVLSTLVLLLVALVAAASFTVIAQRRMRQIGLLAAIGATEKHLRLVMVATGLVVGLVSSLAGVVLGIALWAVGSPMLESPAGHRIDPMNLPWLILGALCLLGVVTSTAAAWMPARAAARVPITAALMSRPPQPRKTHRSVVLAGAFLAAGFGSLYVGDQERAGWMVAGIIATGLGVLFASPLAIRALKHLASHTPVASRLALRDLARYEARSGSALAAISLSLGMAVAVIVVSTAAEHRADTGNLSDRQLLIRTASDCPCLVAQRTPAQIAQLQSVVDSMTRDLDAATVVPLDVAIDPDVAESAQGQVVLPVVSAGKRMNDHLVRDVGQLYVGTPQLLSYLHVDRAAADPQADVLTSQPGVLEYANVGTKTSTPVVGSGDRPTQQAVKGPPPMTTTHIDTSHYTSTPRSVITEAALARHGWAPMRLGWLVESRHPITIEHIAVARTAAVAAGLIVEARSDGRSLATVKSVATSAGIVLALLVLALTVGLIRSEGAADLRTLSATGASSRVRRGLTAATAGAMGLLGVVMGTTIAYLAMLAAYRSDLSRLDRVPLLYLSLISVGVPVPAYAAGWLFATREPRSLRSRTAD
ncbi:MAG: ABC transporter permease [Mycobacteriales bacterium]